jgi:NTP pyrophosphatase (non-canonical NTP hydrolase)
MSASAMKKPKECSNHTARSPEFDIDRFQDSVGKWGDRNFTSRDWHHPLMGLSEELGELNHALLKQEQGIRGSYEEHEAQAVDAVGDIVIFLAHLCHRRGWCLRRAVESAWMDVSQRDWISDPEKGTAMTINKTSEEPSRCVRESRPGK